MVTVESRGGKKSGIAEEFFGDAVAFRERFYLISFLSCCLGKYLNYCIYIPDRSDLISGQTYTAVGRIIEINTGFNGKLPDFISASSNRVICESSKNYTLAFSGFV